MKLNGGFPILYADVPIQYSNQRNGRADMGSPPYDTMSVRELCSLRPLIDKVVAKDSILLLWAQMPKLPELLQIMAAWGYKFTCAPFTWLKLNPTGELWQPTNKAVVGAEEWVLTPKDIVLKKGIYSGMGSYTAGNQELVLMGKRGRGISRQCKSVKQVVMAPRGAHSSKPDEVLTRIQKVWGNAPILELFARGERVRGVIKLGFEIDGLDIREALRRVAE